MPKDFEEKVNFFIYIKNVLKQINPELRLSQTAGISINLMLHEITKRVCNHLSTLLRDGPKTVSSRAVDAAVKLVLNGEIGKNAVNEGTKAVIKYSRPTVNGVRASKASRAGLAFPPSRARSNIKKYVSGVYRIGENASVYLAAVLEYIAAELLDGAATEAIKNNKKVIGREHLVRSVNSDEELKSLFGGSIAISN